MIDDEYLTAWSAETQAAAYRNDREHNDRCSSCGHAWHGMACRAQGASLPCSCATSFEAAA